MFCMYECDHVSCNHAKRIEVRRSVYVNAWITCVCWNDKQMDCPSRAQAVAFIAHTYTQHWVNDNHTTMYCIRIGAICVYYVPDRRLHVRRAAVNQTNCRTTTCTPFAWGTSQCIYSSISMVLYVGICDFYLCIVRFSTQHDNNNKMRLKNIVS